MSGPDLRRAAAARAVALVEDGMRLGIGTGSTANVFVALLGERVRAGLDVIGVPTSEATRTACEAAGIRLTTLDETPELDLTIRNLGFTADEVNLHPRSDDVPPVEFFLSMKIQDRLLPKRRCNSCWQKTT